VLFSYNLSHYTQRNILQKNILKEVNSFLTSSTLLILILFTLSACEDKKQTNKSIPIENSTEILINEDKKVQSEKHQNTEVQKDIHLTTAKEKSSVTSTLSNTYVLKEKKQTNTVTLINKKLSFKDISQPIVLITLFKSSCKPCLSQIKSLDKVSQKYHKQIFVMHLIKEMQDTKFIHAIYDLIDINSDSETPLTLLFKEGEIYSHFEGLAPIEMIVSDIQQAIKK